MSPHGIDTNFKIVLCVQLLFEMKTISMAYVIRASCTYAYYVYDSNFALSLQMHNIPQNQYPSLHRQRRHCEGPPFQFFKFSQYYDIALCFGPGDSNYIRIF